VGGDSGITVREKEGQYKSWCFVDFADNYALARCCSTMAKLEL
jgi:hypothetical protein